MREKEDGFPCIQGLYGIFNKYVQVLSYQLISYQS